MTPLSQTSCQGSLASEPPKNDKNYYGLKNFSEYKSTFVPVSSILQVFQFSNWPAKSTRVPKYVSAQQKMLQFSCRNLLHPCSHLSFSVCLYTTLSGAHSTRISWEKHLSEKIWWKYGKPVMPRTPRRSRRSLRCWRWGGGTVGPSSGLRRKMSWLLLSIIKGFGTENWFENILGRANNYSRSK